MQASEEASEVKRSRKAAIRLVLDAWRDRSWRDQDGAALSVVEAMVNDDEGYGDHVLDALPREFLNRNGITLDDVDDELRRVLQGVEINEGDGAPTEPSRLKILFLAANPLDQQLLRLDEEAREVEKRLRATDHRDVIDFKTCWAVRSGDLIDALNQERPQVVHFSGHGSANDGLVFQDDFGCSKIVSKDAIAATIRTVSDEVRLVLFNNCFSEAHAEEAAKHVEAAIGMNDSIGDVAARVFAATFYAALGYGRSVQTAFDQAKAALKLENIPDDDTPQLFTCANIDPTQLLLVAGP